MFSEITTACRVGVAAGGFLDDRLEVIVDAIAWQTGLSETHLLGTGHGYRDAAVFHSLVVLEGEEVRVVASFAVKLQEKASKSL